MSVDLEWLQAVIADDDLGLLKVKPKNNTPTADDHLIAKFTEISDFVTANNRQPTADMSNVPEYMLHKRLESIRANSEQCQALATIDGHNLLPKPAPVKPINTIDDIFNDDDLGLLNNDSDGIFSLKHVSKERSSSDFVARRAKCKQFADYEPQLKQVQKEIKAGTRKLLSFDDKGESLVAGCYYILAGVLLYVESIELTSPEKTIEGKRFRKDGRTYCVFENGTESNMLYRSLVKELYNEGKIVSDTNIESNSNFYKNMNVITDKDTATGYIYVLSSLSTNPEIRTINNLYKIGYASISIEQRIANAENEPTYLMAPVKLVAGYQCFNLNTQKFEALLHNFFGNACLDIQITDKNGKSCQPREWFIAPIVAIEQVITLIISGDIVNYRYDAIRERVVEI